MLAKILDRSPPPDLIQQLHQLQYTFLAQTGHRDDFHQHLAMLFGGWLTWPRNYRNYRRRRRPTRSCWRVWSRPGLVHGLVMQLLADPNAFDRTAMLESVLDFLKGAMPTQSRKWAWVR